MITIVALSDTGHTPADVQDAEMSILVPGVIRMETPPSFRSPATPLQISAGTGKGLKHQLHSTMTQENEDTHFLFGFFWGVFVFVRKRKYLKNVKKNLKKNPMMEELNELR